MYLKSPASPDITCRRFYCFSYFNAIKLEHGTYLSNTKKHFNESFKHMRNITSRDVKSRINPAIRHSVVQRIKYGFWQHHLGL